MCCGCWEEYGKPQINDGQVQAAALLVWHLEREGIPSLGPLHIHIDDWNIEDEFFVEPIENVPGWETLSPNLTDGERDIVRKLYSLLASMTVQQRASALALNEGFWKLPAFLTPDEERRALDFLESDAFAEEMRKTFREAYEERDERWRRIVKDAPREDGDA